LCFFAAILSSVFWWFMFAIVSDIHSNLEALDAVLADIASRGITTIYCLGDVVGYGPNPIECIERVLNWELVLKGNHDHAVTYGAEGFGKYAERAVNWTRAVLVAQQRTDLRAFLGSRPQVRRDPEMLFVHGSPRNPTNEYLFPEDTTNEPKMAANAALIDHLCFCGHTHVPGVFVEPWNNGGSWQFNAPDDIDHHWRFTNRKTIVNVGAVGQPRDGDWRACYVTVNGADVYFHRVEYDVEATIDKIRDIQELSSSLSERLREGR
jgi:diadenosine tetraphosphatase ApaH/serine/threonine PP2A family protein phosphatase